MHPYLTHLFTDIAAACRDEIVIEQKGPISFEEEMEEIERWLEGAEPAHSFGYYCGLESVNFPPPEQLTREEMEQVIAAFRQMMLSWNLDIDLPASLPLPMAYAITIDTLNMKTGIVNSGFISFDFCTGYAPDCIFKQYCPCLKIWNETDDDDCADMTEVPPGELPF
ncbi:MAG: hypothetical protein JWQ40_2176 [Segetibacter sp.]|nr:hypothetical protein [Segetibacter sp.]